MEFEDYCKVQQIDVNTLSEEQFEDTCMDYFFDIARNTKAQEESSDALY